jgi:hypothetical protein
MIFVSVLKSVGEFKKEREEKEGEKMTVNLPHLASFGMIDV